MIASPSAFAAEAPYPLTALDLAAGLPAGIDRSHAPAIACGDMDFASTLRSSIQNAIVDSQSYVSFSGGRDSSAVLAIATDVARRAGQSDPVPLTIRVVGSTSASETNWQELVIRHLRLDDWVRIPVTEELDILGPVATRVLRRHGLLFPANAYFHDLIAEFAGPGVLLSGAGGDELLEGSYAHHHARALLGLERLTVRNAAAIALSVGGRSLWNRYQARQVPRLPWLRPRAQTRFARRLVGSNPAPVRGWAAGVASIACARSMVGLAKAMDLIGSAAGMSIVNPFADPAVVGAAMAHGGRIGLGGRAAAMRTLTTGLLPDVISSRQTKASFEDALWTRSSRGRFQYGDLIDIVAADEQIEPLLKVDALRAEWQRDVPHFLTALLAQAAHVGSTR